MSALDMGTGWGKWDAGRRWHSLQGLGVPGAEAVLLQSAGGTSLAFGLAKARRLDR